MLGCLWRAMRRQTALISLIEAPSTNFFHINLSLLFCGLTLFNSPSLPSPPFVHSFTYWSNIPEPLNSVNRRSITAILRCVLSKFPFHRDCIDDTCCPLLATVHLSFVPTSHANLFLLSMNLSLKYFTTCTYSFHL